MALLQIAEPGMSTAPHDIRLAVGIDLGTTNSLVATVRHGTPEVLLDAQGQALLPSVVRYFADGHIDVGAAAKAAQDSDPANTVSSIKRMMGRGLADLPNRKSLPYHFVDVPGMVKLETAGGVKSPVEVSADILSVLRARAEMAFDEDLAGAVITVPAYFDDAQRQATKDAAKLAGIHVLRLLNEPTAAAVAYGLDNAPEGIFAAYDLGGGTFDISVLRLNRGIFEVLATGGDSHLGGDDFDHCVFSWVLEQASLKDLSAEEAQLLMTASRQAKEALSEAAETKIEVKLPSGKQVSLTLSVDQFETMTMPLVERTLHLIAQTVQDAGLAASDVDGVMLIGGATRMPHIRRQVAGLFGKEPLASIDPDKVVALGAAIQANMLVGNRAPGDDWLLLDVIPLSLGVETMGGLVEKIIPRNSTIPCAFAQDFTTFRDGQTAMAVHVLQGERELVSDCRSLARFELRGIPPMVAGSARIRITYQVDADGLLSVSARELSSGVEASVVVKPSYGLTDEEVVQMLMDSSRHVEDDMKSRALMEEKVEAERTLLATQSALDADGDLLEEKERTDIIDLIAAVKAVLGSGKIEDIRSAVNALSEGTEHFAALRMDRSIKEALSGRKVDDMEGIL
ncbi:MAG: Fe-S protein assembly chaperone HscA [Oxalobacter sp.]|nr:Fe-S protein assembly chaperone HscA [Oxalobacter sp.]